MKQFLSDLGLVTVGDERAWAVTSPDDKYRYILGRTWDNYFWSYVVRPIWVFCMLNPSKARVRDDPTIRKCSGFAKRGDAGGFLVVNLLAYSETKPANVVRAHRSGVRVRDHRESVNVEAIRCACRSSAVPVRYIAGWGRVPAALGAVVGAGKCFFEEYAGGKLECFGRNADGSPRLPLMLPYNTPIVPFRGEP